MLTRKNSKMFRIKGTTGQRLRICSLGIAHACVLGCVFEGNAEERGYIYLNFLIYNNKVVLLLHRKTIQDNDNNVVCFHLNAAGKKAITISNNINVDIVSFCFFSFLSACLI